MTYTFELNEIFFIKSQGIWEKLHKVWFWYANLVHKLEYHARKPKCNIILWSFSSAKRLLLAIELKDFWIIIWTLIGSFRTIFFPSFLFLQVKNKVKFSIWSNIDKNNEKLKNMISMTKKYNQNILYLGKMELDKTNQKIQSMMLHLLSHRCPYIILTRCNIFFKLRNNQGDPNSYWVFVLISISFLLFLIHPQLAFCGIPQGLCCNFL